MTALGEALEGAGFVRRRPPLPPEAGGSDGKVPIRAYNHPCPASGCRTWVPNHHDLCVEHRTDLRLVAGALLDVRLRAAG